MDLKDVNIAEQCEKGYEFELLLPEIKTPTGAFITVRGLQAKSVRSWARREYAELQQRELVAKRRGREVDPISLEEGEDYMVESAVQRIIGWREIKDGGVPVEFSADSARRILKEHSWIRDQVIQESDLLGNFIKG